VSQRVLESNDENKDERKEWYDGQDDSKDEDF
jgi:hypothetical protein